MDRHAATRRLRRRAAVAGVRLPRVHPHMLRHTFVPTMLDAGVDLRDVQIAARHADPHALRPHTQAPRPPPELHPGRVHGVRHLTASAEASARPLPGGVLPIHADGRAAGRLLLA